MKCQIFRRKSIHVLVQADKQTHTFKYTGLLAIVEIYKTMKGYPFFDRKTTWIFAAETTAKLRVSVYIQFLQIRWLFMDGNYFKMIQNKHLPKSAFVCGPSISALRTSKVLFWQMLKYELTHLPRTELSKY